MAISFSCARSIACFEHETIIPYITYHPKGVLRIWFVSLRHALVGRVRLRIFKTTCMFYLLGFTGMSLYIHFVLVRLKCYLAILCRFTCLMLSSDSG
jgi:hypothetical protein